MFNEARYSLEKAARRMKKYADPLGISGWGQGSLEIDSSNMEED